jgi:hypothetical protein
MPPANFRPQLWYFAVSQTECALAAKTARIENQGGSIRICVHLHRKADALRESLGLRA